MYSPLGVCLPGGCRWESAGRELSGGGAESWPTTRPDGAGEGVVAPGGSCPSSPLSAVTFCAAESTAPAASALFSLAAASCNSFLCVRRASATCAGVMVPSSSAFTSLRSTRSSPQRRASLSQKFRQGPGQSPHIVASTSQVLLSEL